MISNSCSSSQWFVLSQQFLSLFFFFFLQSCPIVAKRMYELKFLFGIVVDRSEIPRGPDVNRDVSRSRSLVIRSYWVHLWCSPSAGRNQSAGRLYKRAADSPAQLVLCSQSQHHQLALFNWMDVGFIFSAAFWFVCFNPFVICAVLC